MEANPYIQPNAMPKSLRYSETQPLGLQGVSKVVTFAPSSAHIYTDTANTECIIPISSSTSFLDPSQSYLTFDFTYRFDAPKVAADPPNAPVDYITHAAHFIQSLRVVAESSSTELENITHYPRLHSMLFDNQASSDHKASFEAEFRGIRVPLDQGNVIAANDEKVFTFSVSLMSLLGTAQTKLIPLFATGPILLAINFGDLALKLGTLNLTRNFKISKVRYMGCIVDLADKSINARLQQMIADPGTGLYMHFASWRQYQYAHTNDNVVPINDSSKSANMVLFGIFKNSAFVLADDRLHRDGTISSLQVRTGNELIPATPLRGDALLQCELDRALGVLHDLDHCGLPKADKLTKRAFGMSLMSFGPKSGVLSGQSLLNNRGLEIIYSSVTVNPQNYQCYTFINYDVVLRFLPDGRLDRYN